MDTRSYFTCLFDLLELPLHDTYLEFASLLEQDALRPVFFAHPLQFVFEGYRSLLLAKETPDFPAVLESFMALGDVTSTLPLSPASAPLDAQIWLDAFVERVTADVAPFRNALVLVA